MLPREGLLGSSRRSLLPCAGGGRLCAALRGIVKIRLAGSDAVLMRPAALSWLPVAKVTTSVVPPGSRASASMNQFLCALLPGALVVGSFGL